MARVLWLGDAGCTTGFGRVTHSIGDRLVETYGHDVHVLAVNYDGDAGRWKTPMRLYMANKLSPTDLYGQRRFVEMLGLVDPDIVVMLNDPYVVLKFLYRNKFDEHLLLARTKPMLAYMPVDGYDHPRTWTRMPKMINNLAPIKGGTGPDFTPVVMSEHGHTMFPGAPLVHHGIDSDLFRPVSERPVTMSNGDVIRSKADAKRALGMTPDTFMILRVDRNSPRKNYADTWKAVTPLMRKYSDIMVWFHCRVEGDSIEIPQLVARDPATAQRFMWPGNFSTKIGWTNEDLVVVYNAADLFVSTSWGEGFGLTLGEAIATGLPVIAQNVSAIPETVGPGGVLIEPERRITVEAGHDQWLPNVEAFTAEIERLYLSRGARRSLGEAGRKHAKSLTWDEAARRFDQLITTVLSRTRVHEEGDAPWEKS